MRASEPIPGSVATDLRDASSSLSAHQASESVFALENTPQSLAAAILYATTPVSPKAIESRRGALTHPGAVVFIDPTKVREKSRMSTFGTEEIALDSVSADAILGIVGIPKEYQASGQPALNALAIKRKAAEIESRRSDRGVGKQGGKLVKVPKVAIEPGEEVF